MSDMTEEEAKARLIREMREAWDDMTSQERWEALLRALNLHDGR